MNEVRAQPERPPPLARSRRGTYDFSRGNCRRRPIVAFDVSLSPYASAATRSRGDRTNKKTRATFKRAFRIEVH